MNKLRFISLLLVLLLLTGLTLRDPTQPPKIISMPKSLSSNNNQPLKLYAVYISADDHWAIINNQLVRVGDHLDEFTITSITPYTVQLVGEQNQNELLQLAPEVKVKKS